KIETPRVAAVLDHNEPRPQGLGSVVKKWDENSVLCALDIYLQRVDRFYALASQHFLKWKTFHFNGAALTTLVDRPCSRAAPLPPRLVPNDTAADLPHTARGTPAKETPGFNASLNGNRLTFSGSGSMARIFAFARV